MKKLFWLGIAGFLGYSLWKARQASALTPAIDSSGPIYAGVPEVPQYEFQDPMEYAIRPMTYAGAQEDLMQNAKELMAQAQEMMSNL
jgi:hypothetical protein